MPAAHRAHLEWTPSRLITWGATVGPATAVAASFRRLRGHRDLTALIRVLDRTALDSRKEVA